MGQSRRQEPSGNVGPLAAVSSLTLPSELVFKTRCCSLAANLSPPSSRLSAAMSESANVSGAQGRRLEESSAAGGSLPGLRLNQNGNQAVLSHLMANTDSAEPDDDFFDMLVKCQVRHPPDTAEPGEVAATFVLGKTVPPPTGLTIGRPALRPSHCPPDPRAHRTRRGLLQPHHALASQADGRATGDSAVGVKPCSQDRLALRETKGHWGTALHETRI